MANPSGANFNEIPKLVLNPMPISVAPPRSPVHPSVLPLVQPFMEHFESREKKGNKNKKRKHESPAGSSSENERPDFLPQGWEIKEFTRKTGNMAGSKYKQYIEPGTKRVFRSLKEIRRHLGLSEPPKKTRTANKMNGSMETEFQRAREVSMDAKEEEEKVKAENKEN